MFIIDDFLVWIFKKIHNIAIEELEDTPEKLKKELLELQMLLEAGQISEEQHLKKEKNILERLDALQEKLSSVKATEGKK